MVQDEIGYALYLAQVGGKHVKAKPLKGLGAGVLEVVSDPPQPDIDLLKQRLARAAALDAAQEY